MNVHLENIKKLLDYAVVRGLFKDAESVQQMNESFKAMAEMVKDYERLKSGVKRG
jgi:hypothetical protein